MSSRLPPAPAPFTEMPPVPDWIARDDVRTPDDAVFRAGAALAHLHAVAMETIDAMPMRLFRDRLALGAAEAGLVRSGGRARAGDLRDRSCLLPAGAAMDAETARFALWRRAVATSLRSDAVPRLILQTSRVLGTGDDIGEAVGAAWREARRGADPLGAAAGLLAAGRQAIPDDPDAPLLLADAALARTLGWPHLLPLLAMELTRRDMSLEAEALRQACAGAVARAAIRAARLAADLARRADRLCAVAPRLRSKASGAAVALFLARDAVAPTMGLAPVVRGTRVPMSPRAAARICDRLTTLGVVRELTGRATSRLYGL